jgi:hypothetical protein
MALTDETKNCLLAAINSVSATDELIASLDETDAAMAGSSTVFGLLAGAQTFTGTKTFSNLVYPTVARTATATGATTGTIADAGSLQFVTVTSGNATHIIILPTPTPGTIVVLSNGATGYELRTSAPATIAINGGSGADAESAIAASTMVIAVCTSATTWQAIGLAGTTLAAVEAAA